MKLFDRVLNPREIRRRLGLNQEQFWTQIGVTQSGGSRYESGREMPKPVRELLRLVHVEQIDLSQVKRVDFEIISYLKESHADLYRTLRRAVKGRNRAGGAPLDCSTTPRWAMLRAARIVRGRGGPIPGATEGRPPALIADSPFSRPMNPLRRVRCFCSAAHCRERALRQGRIASLRAVLRAAAGAKGALGEQ